MKVIKKFRDGTALVQKPGKNPEIISADDLDKASQMNLIEVSSITSEGFIIDTIKLSVSTGTKFVIEMNADGNVLATSKVIKGQELISFFENLINNINAR